MSSTRNTIKTVYSDRAQLTAGEEETIESLDAAFAADRIPEGREALTEVRKSLAKDTREALRSAIPDLEERGRSQRERIMPELERLKGTALQPLDDPVMRHELPESIAPRDDSTGVLRGQPAHVGELWRASVSGFSSDPNAIVYDIDQDPLRIFGHIGYSGDALRNGTVGLAMTFTLPPERTWYGKGERVYTVDPVLRIQGFISGYTGFYHPLFAADDKWSKCWESVEATVTLSSGEWLAGNSIVTALTDLENVYPVGMETDNRFFGWLPGPLKFTANMRHFRERGVSVILRAALRYDFQLEGESDIWFRGEGGSASESVPAFDNALNFRCEPGLVKSIR